MQDSNGALPDFGSAQARFEMVGPERAQELLTRHEPREGERSNRSVRPAKVKEYARQMKAGGWRLSWDAVAFDRDGNNRNGQHRLLGVVDSGITVPLLVLEGLDPMSSDVGDRGAPRTLGDIFYLDGERNARTLAAVVRGIWLFETTGVPFSGFGRQTDALLPHVAREVLERHPGVRDHLTRRDMPLLTPSQVSTFSYLFNFIDNDDAAAFLSVVESGQVEGRTVPTTDPRYRLRERLLVEQARRSSGRVVQTNGLVVSAWVVRAWNAYRRNEEISIFRWRAGGARPDRYPLIDGWEYTDAALAALDS